MWLGSQRVEFCPSAHGLTWWLQWSSLQPSVEPRGERFLSQVENTYLMPTEWHLAGLPPERNKKGIYERTFTRKIQMLWELGVTTWSNDTTAFWFFERQCRFQYFFLAHLTLIWKKENPTLHTALGKQGSPVSSSEHGKWVQLPDLPLLLWCFTSRTQTVHSFEGCIISFLESSSYFLSLAPCSELVCVCSWKGTCAVVL